MKTLIAFFALLPVIGLADSADNYVNFVRQIQADSGVEWDVTVAQNGEMLSPEGVGPEGSHYQLWSIHATSASDFLLDEEFVSAYSPTGRITIETGDPYDVIPRTRCDQPFRVFINVDGLTLNPSNSPDIPVAASQVHLGHKVAKYGGREYAFTPDKPADWQEMISGYIGQNGTVQLDYPSTNLTGRDRTKLKGEEVFTVSALEDYGVTEAVLDSAKLQIWPIADARVTGIDTNELYTDIPPVTVALKKLYPDSTTYVRIYKGLPSATPVDPLIVLTSYVEIEDAIPQKRTLLLDNLNEYFVGADTFTLEVLHETPFGIDILEQVYPIGMAKALTVRGTLFSQE